MPSNLNVIYFLFLFHTTLYKLACAEGDQSKPFIEWCENAQERRRAEDCGGLAFVYPYPKCYCLHGIALIKVANDAHGVREVQFGTGGCVSHRFLGVHNRTIELAHAPFNATDTILGLQISEDSFAFLNAPLNEPKPVGRRIVLFNGDLIDTGHIFKGERLYCVEKSGNSGDDSDLVRMMAVPPASWVWFNESCHGGERAELEILHAGRLLTPEASPCYPDCPPYDPKMVTYNRPSPHLTNTTNCKPMPHKLRDVHRDLNERMLRHAIDHSFEGQPEPNDNKPSNSFKILEMLSRVASKFCRNAHVPLNFLEIATDYFKVAHEGRGYYFNEEFSHHEFMSISRLLRRCLFYMNQTLQFESTGCTDQREVTQVFKLTAPMDRTPVVKSVGHEYFDHHAVLDVPWTMVDLVNVACVDAFAHSYRMYHRMVQGMERLFTHELRTFWRFPQVPPFYYEHLFGPHWKTHSSNLEKCVEGAYIFAPKMARMIRPQWISGQTENSRGRGTLTDPVCRRTRTDLNSISEAFEIYCEPAKPPSDIFIDWPDFDADDPSPIVNENYIDWSESNQSLSSNEIYIDAEYDLPDIIDPITSNGSSNIVDSSTVGNEVEPSPVPPVETTSNPAYAQNNHTTMKPTELAVFMDLPESGEHTPRSSTVKYYVTWPHRIARQSETIPKVPLSYAAISNNSLAASPKRNFVPDSVSKSKAKEFSNYIDEIDQLLEDTSINEPRQSLRERRSFTTKHQTAALINWPSDPGDPLLPSVWRSPANSEYHRHVRTSPKFKTLAKGVHADELYGLGSNTNDLDPLISGGPDPDLDALITWRNEDIHTAGGESIETNGATDDAPVPIVASYSKPAGERPDYVEQATDYLSSNPTGPSTAPKDQKVNDASGPNNSPTADALDYPVENLSDALETKNPSVPSSVAAERTLADTKDFKSTVKNYAEGLDYPVSDFESASEANSEVLVEWPAAKADEAGISNVNAGAGVQDGDPLVSGNVLDYTGEMSAVEDEQPIYLVWPGDLYTKSKRQSYPDIFLDWPQTNVDTDPSKVVNPAAPEPAAPSRKDAVGPPGVVLDLHKRPNSNKMHPPGTLLDLQKRTKPSSFPPGTLLDLRRRKKPQSFTPKGKLLDLSKRRKFVPPGHHNILLDLPKRKTPKPSLVQPVGKLLDLQKHSKTPGRVDVVDEEPVYIRWPSALTRRVRESQWHFPGVASTHRGAKKSKAVENVKSSNFLHTHEANELQDIYPMNDIEASDNVLDPNDADDIYPTEGLKTKRSGKDIVDPTSDIYPQEHSGSSNDYPDFSDTSSHVAMNHPRSVVADDLYDGPPMLDSNFKLENSNTLTRTNFQQNSSERTSAMKDKFIALQTENSSTASSTDAEPSQLNDTGPVRTDLQLLAENHTSEGDPVQIRWPVGNSPASSNGAEQVTSPTRPTVSQSKSNENAEAATSDGNINDKTIRIDLKISNNTSQQESGSDGPIRIDLPMPSDNSTEDFNNDQPAQIDLQIQNQSVVRLEHASKSKPIRPELPIIIPNGTSDPVGTNGTKVSNSATGTIIDRPLDSDVNDPIVYINLPPKEALHSAASRSSSDENEKGFNGMEAVPHKINFPSDASIVDMYVPTEGEGLSCTHSNALHGFMPFKNSCNLFYACNVASKMTMLVVFKCNDGYIFKPSEQNCVVGACEG